MATKQEVQAMRSKMTDAELVQKLYTSDSSFRTVVDAVDSSFPNLTSVEKAKMPTYLIDRHYNGSFYPNKTRPSARTQNTMVNANTQQKQLAQEGKMSQWSGLLSSSPVEEASVGGFAGNLLKSGGRMIGDVFNAVTNPIDTAKGLGKAVLGGGINAIESATGNEEMFDNPFGSEDVASQIGDFYVQRYGSLEGLKKTAYEDPVGLLSDVATLITGVGGAVKGVGTLGKVGAKTAGMAGASLGAVEKASTVAGGLQKAGNAIARTGLNAEPLVVAGKTAKGIGKTAGAIGRFGVSQATGLGQDTISTIARNPAFKEAKQGTITRTGLGDKVKGAITSLQDEISDTGKGYSAFREGKQVVKVKQNLFRDHLQKQGFAFDDSGKLFDSINGPKLTLSEINEVNGFLKTVDDLGETMTDNQFLRVRERLSKLAKFEKNTRQSNDIETLAKGMREAFNKEVRPSIKGLGELDAKYGPEREFLDLVERDFIDPRTGELKDSAIPRIANSSNKEGTQFLKRLKELVPGIEQEVNALKAMEDVTHASGPKVGVYARAAVGAAGLATGNIPVIIGAILSTPSIAIRFIRGYGKVAGLGQSTVSGILNKLKLGQKLSAEQASIMSAALQWAELQDKLPDEE